MDSAALMVRYGAQLAVAGTADGCPLLAGNPPEQPSNVVSIALARTQRAIAQCLARGAFDDFDEAS